MKYDYLEFSFDILEYCDKSILISREQYYLDLLKPEYNICKIAGSTLGYKHSEITKAKMSLLNMGVNNPLFGRKHSVKTRTLISLKLKGVNHPWFGRKHTCETKAKLSMANRGVNSPRFGKKHTEETKLKISKTNISKNFSNIIIFYDQLNTLVREFLNIHEVAKHLNVSIRTLYRYLNKNIVYKNFIIKSKRSNNK